MSSYLGPFQMNDNDYTIFLIQFPIFTCWSTSLLFGTPDLPRTRVLGGKDTSTPTWREGRTSPQGRVVGSLIDLWYQILKLSPEQCIRVN